MQGYNDDRGTYCSCQTRRHLRFECLSNHVIYTTSRVSSPAAWKNASSCVRGNVAVRHTTCVPFSVISVSLRNCGRQSAVDSDRTWHSSSTIRSN